jgi:hypothetical protein
MLVEIVSPIIMFSVGLDVLAQDFKRVYIELKGFAAGASRTGRHPVERRLPDRFRTSPFQGDVNAIVLDMRTPNGFTSFALSQTTERGSVLKDEPTIFQFDQASFLPLAQAPVNVFARISDHSGQFGLGQRQPGLRGFGASGGRGRQAEQQACESLGQVHKRDFHHPLVRTPDPPAQEFDQPDGKLRMSLQHVQQDPPLQHDQGAVANRADAGGTVTAVKQSDLAEYVAGAQFSQDDIFPAGGCEFDPHRSLGDGHHAGAWLAHIENRLASCEPFDMRERRETSPSLIVQRLKHQALPEQLFLVDADVAHPSSRRQK